MNCSVLIVTCAYIFRLYKITCLRIAGRQIVSKYVSKFTHPSVNGSRLISIVMGLINIVMGSGLISIVFFCGCFVPDYMVQINALHLAICEAFLRFCEANFIQIYKNTKLMKISQSSQKIVAKVTQETQSSNMHFDC